MTRAGSSSRIHLFIAALSVSLLACGGASQGGDGDGDGDGDGASCESAVNCDGIQICDPTDNTCQTDVPCTDHATCGKGGNCNMASGVCEVSTTGSPCESDTQCRDGEACVGVGNASGGFCGCDGEEFEPMPVTPNMLVVLDRSGSMLSDGDANGNSKYSIAEDAVGTLMTDFDGSIRFGLSLYPSDNNCAAGQIDVPVGDNNGSAIIGEVGSNQPVNTANTPLGPTLADVANYQGLEDPTRPNYVIAMTDGQPNCNDSDPTNEVEALFDKQVRTFVIGFGDNVNEGVLNDMAQAGGTARMMGGEDYYQADSAQELEDAFNTIGGTVLACSFQLEADEDAIVRVFFDGNEVPSGWTFDPANGTITFDDLAVCDQLQEGNVDELVIVNSCPLGTE